MAWVRVDVAHSTIVIPQTLSVIDPLQGDENLGNLYQKLLVYWSQPADILQAFACEIDTCWYLSSSQQSSTLNS